MTELCVSVATHHFVVTRINPRAMGAVAEFARTLVLVDDFKNKRSNDPWRNSEEKNKDKVFAAATLDKTERRYHINHLPIFKEVLKRHYIHDGMVEWKTVPLPPAPTVMFKLIKDAFDPRDYQVPIIDYIVDDEGPRSRAVDLQTGQGKFQNLDAKIKVPGGWSTMGEMQVGTMVTAWDGTPSEVIGVYPQGKMPLYRVTFADGRSTEAGAEHLWAVYYINTQPHLRWRVVNTLEVLRLISMPNPRVYIQLIEPEDGPDLSLPIPPYTLGAIIGDGCTMANGLTVTKLDEDFFQNMAEELPAGHQLVRRDEKTRAITGPGGAGGNQYINALRELGLMGCRSFEKFIPEAYLHGSYKQRLALVQGLLDADGTVSRNEGCISFSTTSEPLAKAMQYLIRSLGGIAKIVPRFTNYTYLGEYKTGRQVYEVDIRHKYPSSLFSIARKKGLTSDSNQYAKSLKLRVKSVEYVGDKEAQCIAIAHPSHLYVTDDFIVTHNTFIGLRAAYILGKRIVMILKPKYVQQWIKEFKAAYDIPDKEICEIGGSKDLMSLLNMADGQDLPYKVIIISNATYRNWLALYRTEGKHILDMGYACLPQDLFQHVKAGFRMIDEVHEDFHLNFKCDLFTNVERSLSLSATWLFDQPFLVKMMNVAYPPQERYIGGEYIKYVNSFYLTYRFREPEKIKTNLPGNSSYSHHAFEQSVIKNPRVLENYFQMIQASMVQTYFKNYKAGQKCLIYCISIDMCTRLTAWLKARYPDKDVRRFVENDPDDDLYDADICVSSIQNAGTGKDIKRLATVILTIAINSSQSNIQGFGRLRQPKEGWTPEFVYFVCEDVLKHWDYHEKKAELLASRALSNIKRVYSELI